MLEITFITSIKKLVSDSKCLVLKITHTRAEELAFRVWPKSVLLLQKFPAPMSSKLQGDGDLHVQPKTNTKYTMYLKHNSC